MSEAKPDKLTTRDAWPVIAEALNLPRHGVKSATITFSTGGPVEVELSMFATAEPEAAANDG